MNCNVCKDLFQKPVKTVSVYVKKHETKMNRAGFTKIGEMCPSCKKIIVGAEQR